MARKVRAAVLVDDRRLEIREFPRPAVGPDEGLLRVEASGICGSDVEQYHGALRSLGMPYPAVLGHEPVGIVDEIGEVAAQRWGVEAGDRVAVEPFLPCGHCDLCRSGRYTSCEASGRPLNLYSSIGTDVPPALWGGHAEYMYLHPNTVLHKVSKAIPADIAVMFNPLGAGVRWACQIPGTKLGDTVVVLGAGQRGLACVIAVKAVGAGTVIITDLAAAERKLNLARELGADHAIGVDREDAVARVCELTDGTLADVVVDVSAYATRPIVDALEMAKPGGTIVLAGLKGGKEIPGFVSDRIVQRSLTIKGAWGVDSPAYKQAIRLIESGRYPLERMRTHTFGLEETETAIRTLGGEIPGEDAIHVVVRPSGMLPRVVLS